MKFITDIITKLPYDMVVNSNFYIYGYKQFQRHKKEQEVIWKFADALWQWREVKEQTDNVDLAIEREFLFDETALATKVIFEDPPSDHPPKF